jgi:hypothetical protein
VRALVQLHPPKPPPRPAGGSHCLGCHLGRAGGWIAFEQKGRDYLLWGCFRSGFASSSTPAGCLLPGRGHRKGQLRVLLGSPSALSPEKPRTRGLGGTGGRRGRGPGGWGWGVRGPGFLFCESPLTIDTHSTNSTHTRGHWPEAGMWDVGTQGQRQGLGLPLIVLLAHLHLQSLQRKAKKIPRTRKQEVRSPKTNKRPSAHGGAGGSCELGSKHQPCASAAPHGFKALALCFCSAACLMSSKHRPYASEAPHGFRAVRKISAFDLATQPVKSASRFDCW